MSITTYLDDFDADLEMKTVLVVALERTRVSLGLDKFANGIIARRIVELAKSGERNSDLLCDRHAAHNSAGVPIHGRD